MKHIFFCLKLDNDALTFYNIVTIISRGEYER